MGNLNYISFVTWAVARNPNWRFAESLTPQKIEQLSLFAHFFPQTGLEIWILCLLIWSNFEKFEKIEKLTKNCHSESVNNIAVQLWITVVSEKISAKTGLFHRWFLALKFFVFSAVQSWISAVQRFSGNEQRWNRPEIILNQSWSSLNVSETSTRVSYWWL